MLCAAVLVWVLNVVSRRGGSGPTLVESGLFGLAIGLTVSAVTMLWKDRRRGRDT